MPDFPHPWDAYSILQKKLARRCHVDDHSWGLEAGLSRLLAVEAAPGEVDRVVQSESRKERYRRALRRTYLPAEDSTTAPERAISASRRLRLIESRLDPGDWALLCALGEGNEYTELAARMGVAAGALRVRVLRLRRALVA